jgi:uncharacterized protein
MAVECWSSLHRLVVAGIYQQEVYDSLRGEVDLLTPSGNSTLHLACTQENDDVFIHLLNADADVNATNKSGETPLHWVCRSQRSSWVKTLLKCGASLSAIDAQGDPPLHWAIEADNPRITRLLLSRGASPYVVNRAGQQAADVADFWDSTRCRPLL